MEMATRFSNKLKGLHCVIFILAQVRILGLHSTVRSPQSAVRSPQSAVRSPQSAVRSPQSRFKPAAFHSRRNFLQSALRTLHSLPRIFCLTEQFIITTKPSMASMSLFPFVHRFSALHEVFPKYKNKTGFNFTAA